MSQSLHPGDASALKPSFTSPRRAARYPFAAKVALSESGSDVRVLGLTTDLSEGGCCVRVEEVFPRGTVVELEITKNGESLKTTATVAYGLPPNVMGLSFAQMNASHKAILDNWLDQAIPTLRRGIAETNVTPSPSEPLSITSAGQGKAGY